MLKLDKNQPIEISAMVHGSRQNQHCTAGFMNFVDFFKNHSKTFVFSRTRWVKLLFYWLPTREMK